MINSLLIANRGEIARRVMRTAQRMGIRCIAVYSEADAQAPHVREADEAVLIGPAAASESYLLGDKIIEVAKQTGADAIHPGYGFLSENAEFAEACAANDIIFVGPSADAIRAMGLKDQAKALMERAEVPVTPGYHEENQDPDVLKAAADKIGYPVLIKAVAGGGGKGMRKVDAAEDFLSSLESCKREASKSFSDDRVLIEKFITNPRHIEVQVFGDSRGRVIHLYERDCSLQRRHQKVIEEAPAPGMTPAVRAAMCSAAINAAKAVNYVGAGTVEFIVDGSGPLREDGFYFMEMNTRLQVEHPVTEEVTGLDLVELQLHVASGGSVPEQNEISLQGHAMEARLYAEDPQSGFLPSTGPLNILRLPDEDDGVRVDTGVEEGGEVSLYYDPMIAKVITYDHDRVSAAYLMAEALEELAVWPVKTNGGFLRNCVLHPDFLDEKLTTGFIGEREADLIPPRVDLVAAGFAALTSILENGDGSDYADPFAVADGWRMNTSARLGDRFEVGEETVSVALSLHDEDMSVSIGDETLSLEGIDGSGGEEGYFFQAAVDDAAVSAEVDFLEEGYLVSSCGHSELYAFPHPDAAADAAEAGGVIKAPMPGKVLALNVSSGDTVTKGQALVVLEAMKMEHSLPAPRDGVIGEVAVSTGDQVAEGDILVAMQEETAEA
ncbi:MAG: acetyl/propionyl/methylcrotonyl-CoA carboxylase subunit alpha [Maricaulis sp.]|uniref:acetyl/propionyl/methylcrotonyl-CoA carboxylase subunit alpha n=1 Tax=Maricaulis sp. TaxID=1486257 RepID=UPI002627D325|nr:acetyl/propionyl/methylcrotonyl-CoA carboxylase subunit alpha [Maricaulis sp.]MDM7983178.1 acetyl/propionyl/methylcrotonyl-CoA carboxylase subunit alpha [Maricaulis sp.]